MILLAGCGGGDFEIAPVLMRRPGADVSPARLARGPLHVPQDAPFNLTYPTSSQTGGGKGEAAADPAGKALCAATCEGAGTAAAEFRLGYKIDLPHGDGAAARISIDVTAQRKLDIRGEGLETSAFHTLWAFIKDSKGVVIKKETLLAAEGAAADGMLHLVSGFDAPLAGDTDYYIIIAGRANASASADERASVRLEVTSAAIVITLDPNRPAAASPPSTP